MVWRREDPCGDESGKIRFETVQYTRGQGLDLGCGPNKIWDHAIGVDNYTETRLFGIQMKPDVVCDCEKLDVFQSASMDWVYSSHLLEHIKDYAGALKQWWRVIKPGGHLVLYLPDEDEYPKVGEDGANVDHKWNVNIDKVVDAMKDVGAWDLLRCEKRNQGREYSIFFVFKKRTDGKRFYSYRNPKPEKTCAIARYGAFGDSIMLSSVLPGLKEQGFHVTIYTTPRGQEVLRHDPHIDAWYIQDTDQVPNHMLDAFWANEAKKFDRWVNLSESVEGAWLALPGRTNHRWPDNLRRKHLDVNYYEFTHDLAGVPHDFRPKFYPTDEERMWAQKERQSIGPFVMYSIGGSSVHKGWPWMDNLIARILVTHKDIRVVTTGGEVEQMGEIGWENEPRVIRRAGKYTIRQTMALLEQCEMVIGPETGILNAASHMPMPKIVLLSHSSANNLTKHWVNTATIEPVNTPCFPCHRMHYGFEYCHKHEETGTALCNANTELETVWAAFDNFMRKAA